MKKATILYVDDEEINLRIFKNTFRKDYVVFNANSAKQGLEILLKEKIDVVITDQRMPRMTGLEFLREVNKRFPSIPPSRLMISGYSDSSAIEEAYDKYHLYKFISKPWNEQELKNAITESLKVSFLPD